MSQSYISNESILLNWADHVVQSKLSTLRLQMMIWLLTYYYYQINSDLFLQDLIICFSFMKINERNSTYISRAECIESTIAIFTVRISLIEFCAAFLQSKLSI